MPRLLIRNVSVLVVPEQGECRVDDARDIHVQDDLIIAITPTDPGSSASEVIDGTGLLAVPGLVNSHTHSPMVMMRGAAEDLAIDDWFNRVWKTFPNGITDGTGDPEAHAAEMRRAVELFEALLVGRDFLFGEFGLADVTAFPFLKYASRGVAAGDVDPFHAVLAEQISLRPGSSLHAWVSRIDALPRS